MDFSLTDRERAFQQRVRDFMQQKVMPRRADYAAQLAEGDTRGATAWLRDSLQRHGGLYAPREVIEKASGAPITESALLDYLEAKFGALYGL